MNKVINIKNTYLLIIIVFGLVGLSMYSTYALFSDSVETEELVSISAISLDINIEDFETYNQIDLKPYEKKSILVNLMNSTNDLNYYKIWFQMINPKETTNLIKISKLNTSLNNTSGTINAGNILEIELNITNYSNKSISLNLGVKNSTTNDIVLDENKSEIYNIDEEEKELIWFTENNDFSVGKCTKFSINDKPSGVYKIELFSSNNNYVKGSLYLNNDKNLYVCVSENGLGNETTQVILKEPNKEWYYTNDNVNKLLSISNNESFILTKNKYLELIDMDDKYKIENSADYYLSNTNSSLNQDGNIANLNNNGYAKISLILEHEKIENNLKVDKVFIDGKLSDYPTSGNYYLKDYDCSSVNTNLYWDNNNYTVSTNNINNNEVCDIYLTTNERLLSSAKQGDYVEYVGVGGTVSNTEVKCSSNECLANVNSCANESYNDYGWKIAYILNDGNELIPYIVSAGIVECINETDIEKLNNLSVKYCNENYVYGNNCNKDTGVVNTWMFNNKDYERIISNGYNVNDCTNLNYIDNMCGYNDNLINIGGSYSIINGSSILNFNEIYNGINSQNISIIGNRVVIKLDPNMKIISGSGLSNDPYKICNNDC